jgi:hypothetical protein
MCGAFSYLHIMVQRALLSIRTHCFPPALQAAGEGGSGAGAEEPPGGQSAARSAVKRGQGRKRKTPEAEAPRARRQLDIIGDPAWSAGTANAFTPV